MSRTTHAPGKSDVVLTPAWCAKDMVDYFDPSGVVLDPCRGEGAFYDLLPEGSPWCEIAEGSDFFDWSESVDWVIGNPPYSLTRPWFKHSYEIADHLLYLVPCRNIWSGYGFLREIHEFGGISEIRTYGTGGRLGFPMGNAVAAFHIQRDYDGRTRLSFYDPLARHGSGELALFDSGPRAVTSGDAGAPSATTDGSGNDFPVEVA